MHLIVLVIKVRQVLDDFAEFSRLYVHNKKKLVFLTSVFAEGTCSVSQTVQFNS